MLDIDVHLGKRLRRRRRIVGMTQQMLGAMVGVRFQQIQKYECGQNRISAARLWQMAEALGVPPSYFYEGLSSTTDSCNGQDSEAFNRKETLDLLSAYYQLGERPRRRLLDLAQSLNGEADAA